MPITAAPILAIDSDERDLEWMDAALEEAREAAREDEVPIGAVIVRANAIVAWGRNSRERDADPLAHAEMRAIAAAARTLGRWRLGDCTLYATLEPCPMCAGALVNARIGRLVYACPDPKAGAVHSLYSIVSDARLNHRMPVTGGVRGDDAAQILRGFFAAKRRSQSSEGV